MTFEEQIVGPTKRLAHKLVDLDHFSGLENICNFMVAVKPVVGRCFPQTSRRIGSRNSTAFLDFERLGVMKSCTATLIWQNARRSYRRN